MKAYQEHTDGLSTVAHACNPSPLGSRVGGWLEVKSPTPVWPTWQNPVSAENIKISQKSFKNNTRPDAVAHTCNPSTMGGQSREIA
ncbi:hypothetical protein AAY473_035772 [Plecturocebus cupreus]